MTNNELPKEFKPVPVVIDCEGNSRQMIEIGMAKPPAESIWGHTAPLCGVEGCSNRVFRHEATCYAHLLGLDRDAKGIAVMPGQIQNWEWQ